MPKHSDDQDSPKNKPTGDYPVGYCRPPKEHQWTPGTPGNPKGRPKRSNDLVDIAIRVGRQKHKVMIGGKLCKLTYNELVVLEAYKSSAQNGNWRARQQVNAWEADGWRRDQLASRPAQEAPKLRFTLKLEEDGLGPDSTGEEDQSTDPQ